jgi:hypothetical protein
MRARVGFQGKTGGWFDLLLMGEGDLMEVLEPTGGVLRNFVDLEIQTNIAILQKPEKAL